jgi:hypothetical protein
MSAKGVATAAAPVVPVCNPLKYYLLYVVLIIISTLIVLLFLMSKYGTDQYSITPYMILSICIILLFGFFIYYFCRRKSKIISWALFTFIAPTLIIPVIMMFF